jgi:hypothetical protein
MRILLALALVSAIAAPSFASTTITGGNIINQTWTPSGSPYIVEGDITIPAGSTLTIQSGVTIQLPPGDLQGSGNPNYTEIFVNGSLVVDGTAAAPVRFAGTATGSWYGLEINSSATSVVLDHVVITNAQNGILATNVADVISANDLDIESPVNGGVIVDDGTVHLDRLRVTGGTTGINVVAGTLAVTNCLITNTSTTGAIAQGTLSLTNCTLDHDNVAINANAITSMAQVVNCLVTNNQNVGVLAYNEQHATVTYSDVWNNMTNYVRVTPGASCITANPQYVSSTDFHLQSSSVAIDAGTTGPDHDLDGDGRPVDGDHLGGAQWDIGAYEFGAMPLSDAGVPSIDAPNGSDQLGGDAGGPQAGHAGGCCEAGGSPTSASVLAVFVAACIGRLRRRRPVG